jgi:hypothetical protein
MQIGNTVACTATTPGKLASMLTATRFAGPLHAGTHTAIAQPAHTTAAAIM